MGHCSTVWCTAADTHLQPTGQCRQCCPFLKWDGFECDIAYHQSVTVLYMLYKNRCKTMHPLYNALPVPYVPMRVTHGALVAHRYTYVLPHCGTSQYRRTFIPLSVLRGTILQPY